VAVSLTFLPRSAPNLCLDHDSTYQQHEYRFIIEMEADEAGRVAPIAILIDELKSEDVQVRSTI
jgi:hypothetical protein